MRENLHYDWHWRWPTKTGQMGNLGGHVLDDCRWTTGVTTMAPRVMSLGGRFGYDGETPNTIISLFDYDAFPILYEIRALPRARGEKVDVYQGITSRGMDRYRAIHFGMIIQCEHGYSSGGRGGGWTYDIQAADISYRLACKEPVEDVRKPVEDNNLLPESLDRLLQRLRANEIDLGKNPLAIGPMLKFDAERGQFVGDDSYYANMLLSRNCRPPFAVSEMV